MIIITSVYIELILYLNKIEYNDLDMMNMKQNTQIIFNLIFIRKSSFKQANEFTSII